MTVRKGSASNPMHSATTSSSPALITERIYLGGIITVLLVVLMYQNATAVPRTGDGGNRVLASSSAGSTSKPPRNGQETATYGSDPPPPDLSPGSSNVSDIWVDDHVITPESLYAAPPPVIATFPQSSQVSSSRFMTRGTNKLNKKKLLFAVDDFVVSKDKALLEAEWRRNSPTGFHGGVRGGAAAAAAAAGGGGGFRPIPGCTKNCMGPGCWANSSGHCFESPFLPKNFTSQGKVLRCPWEPSLARASPPAVSRLLLSNPDFVSPYNVLTAQQRLEAFQYFTSKTLSPGEYYRWPAATCTIPRHYDPNWAAEAKALEETEAKEEAAQQAVAVATAAVKSVATVSRPPLWEKRRLKGRKFPVTTAAPATSAAPEPATAGGDTTTTAPLVSLAPTITVNAVNASRSRRTFDVQSAAAGRGSADFVGSTSSTTTLGDGTKYAPMGENFSFSAKHEGLNNHYRIRNFCLSPVGAMYGYKPDVSQVYDGRDDVGSRERGTASAKFREWVKATKPLKKPAACYLDTKVLIMPVWSRSDNPVHTWHRMAQLNHIKETNFGKNASNVVTAFIFTGEYALGFDPPWLSDPMYWINETAFDRYLRAVSPAHFAVYTTPKVQAAQYRAIGQEWSESAITHPYACFKEAVVYHTCMPGDCAVAGKKPPPRPAYNTFNHRTPDVLLRFTERLRACVGVQPRTGPRLTNPKVILAHRTRSRRWVTAPYLQAVIGLYVEQVLNGTLIVNEMGPSTTPDLVRLYADADIVIGQYGSGLAYSVLMPPGAITIEVNLNGYYCAGGNGININQMCDYGGDMAAAGIHHVVGSIGHNTAWSVTQQASTHEDIGAKPILHLLEAARCLRAGGNPKDCYVDPRPSEHLYIHGDKGGRLLERIARITTPTKYAHYDRRLVRKIVSPPAGRTTAATTATVGTSSNINGNSTTEQRRIDVSHDVKMSYEDEYRLDYIIRYAHRFVGLRGLEMMLVAPCGHTRAVLDEVDVFLSYGIRVVLLSLPGPAGLADLLPGNKEGPPLPGVYDKPTTPGADGRVVGLLPQETLRPGDLLSDSGKSKNKRRRFEGQGVGESESPRKDVGVPPVRRVTQQVDAAATLTPRNTTTTTLAPVAISSPTRPPSTMTSNPTPADNMTAPPTTPGPGLGEQALLPHYCSYDHSLALAADFKKRPLTFCDFNNPAAGACANRFALIVSSDLLRPSAMARVENFAKGVLRPTMDDDSEVKDDDNNHDVLPPLPPPPKTEKEEGGYVLATTPSSTAANISASVRTTRDPQPYGSTSPILVVPQLGRLRRKYLP